MWIDTHCHLDAPEFDADRPAVVRRARAAGVSRLVLPAVAVEHFDTVRDLAHEHDTAYALGIHPLCVDRAHDEDLARLQQALAQHRDDPRLVAVGEIGLDHFVPGLDRERQERFYLAQLKLARDAGLPVRLQLLFYPGCAPDQGAASHRRYAHGLVLEQAHIEYFFGHYIAPGQREDWRFAPLNTPDVEGVAPAWFGLAECDPLVDDGIAYADKLRAAGVAVDLEIYRGVTHEFIKMGRALPQARQAHADAAAALRAAWGS